MGLLLIILVLASVLGYYLRMNDPRFRPPAPEPIPVVDTVDWDKLDTIRSYIIKNYHGPVVDKGLLEGAVKGMVKSLGYGGGEYFNAREFEEVMSRPNMSHGTGIHIGSSDAGLIVISADPGGEGEKAGVLPGDLIMKINGRVYSAEEVERARNLMVSDNNGHVELNIMRGSELMDIRVKLRTLAEPTILTRTDGEIGVIRLPSIYPGSAAAVRDSLQRMQSDGVKGIILDLRNTPTGSLTEGVWIASEFMDEKANIVSIRDTRNKIRDFLSESGEYAEFPVTILINGQTEGTAEFLAGALAEREGVTLVGERSIGEGRVYSYVNLPGGEGIKLASGYLLLPGGAEIQDHGIEPDRVITSRPVNNNVLQNLQDRQMIRAMNFLRSHLEEEGY